MMHLYNFRPWELESFLGKLSNKLQQELKTLAAINDPKMHVVPSISKTSDLKPRYLQLRLETNFDLIKDKVIDLVTAYINSREKYILKHISFWEREKNVYFYR